MQGPHLLDFGWGIKEDDTSWDTGPGCSRHREESSEKPFQFDFFQYSINFPSPGISRDYRQIGLFEKNKESLFYRAHLSNKKSSARCIYSHHVPVAEFPVLRANFLGFPSSDLGGIEGKFRL